MTALLAAYLMIAWVKSIHVFSKGEVEYKIHFTDVNGLRVGDPVNVYGFTSGRVKNISIEKKGALVVVAMDPTLSFFEDASAQILIKELMGGKQVEINPGENGKKLSTGEYITGKTSLDFSTAFAKFGDFLDRFGADRMDSMLTHFDKVAASFGKVGEQMEKQDFGSLFAELRNTSAGINNLLAQMNSKRMMSKMDTAIVSLNRMSGQAQEALSSLNDISNHLMATTLDRADSLMHKLDFTLTKTEDLMESMKNIFSKLEQGNTAAGEFIYDEQFAKDLHKTLDNLNVTLDHFRTKKILVGISIRKKQNVKIPLDE